MIKSDFHLHSSFSGDSEADMELMIRAAAAKGLDTIAITEHMDLDFPITEECPEGCFICDVDAYHRRLMELQSVYSPEITVRFGLELGLQPQVAALNAEVIKKHDFDFVIGSIHVVDRMDIYEPVYFDGRSDEEAYRRYFEAAYENFLSFNDFDVAGHLDYVVRKGRTLDRDYSYDKYRDILDKILIHLVDSGKGIEINTGAITYGLRELNPCTDIIRKYKQLGGEIITVGSDAHRPEDVARGYKRAEQVLKDAGFDYYTTFESRRPVQNKL